MLKSVQNLAKSRKIAFVALAALAVGLSLFAALVLVSDIFGDGSEEGSRVYRKLNGDRVLIMSSDTNELCSIEHQSWDCLKTVAGLVTYWVRENTTATTLTGLNLLGGTMFTMYRKSDDAMLWHLENCRMGNTYPSSNSAALKDYQNHLPYSSTAKSVRSRNAAVSRMNASQIIFQNTPDAQIVSSCLDEGIGTVYFDAVNGFTGYLKSQLAVEVAVGVWKTNATGRVESRVFPDDLDYDESGRLVPPDDANADEIVRLSDGEDEIGALTETNRYGRCAWVRAQTRGRLFTGNTATDLPAASELTLACATGGSADNFYRFWAPIQDAAVNPVLAPYCHGPMRFRLKRLDRPSDDGRLAEDDLDGKSPTAPSGEPAQKYNALIIADNVIASYPAMKATPVARGQYVPAPDPHGIVGWTDVFSSKCPAAGESGLTARAGVSAVSNTPPAEIDYSLAQWITSANLNYRWRYLEQRIDEDWATLELKPDAASGELVSTETATMPSEVGDVEFYYSADLDAPYYKYVDYSGSDKGVAGYSERIAHVVTRLDTTGLRAAGLPDPLPSLGTNFFFRLREGTSPQFAYFLETRPGGATEEAETATNYFFVAGNGTWRTYLRVETNEVGWADREYRVVGLEPSGWWGGAAIPAIPSPSRRLARSDEPTSGWAPIRLDGESGHLLFQLSETADDPDTLTLSIVHADYQNVNQWTSAIREQDGQRVFLGTYSDNTNKTGVSSNAHDYPDEFAQWAPLEANRLWVERFPTQSGKTPEDGWGGYKAYNTFPECETPGGGWLAGQGMWVCRQYRASSANGEMALQMEGQGRGSLEYVDTETTPHGLDTFSFQARVAQFDDFRRFSYYSGKSIADMRNYLFTAKAAMADNVAAQNFDGNGSISLFAYYQPNEGCYEARIERTASSYVRLKLFKWAFDGSTVTAKQVGLYNANLNWTTVHMQSSLKKADPTSEDQKAAYYGSVFIHCVTEAGKTTVYAGLISENATIATSASGKTHYAVKFEDTADDRYTFGTFGFTAQNCLAQIINPQCHWDGATIDPEVEWTKYGSTYPNFYYKALAAGQITFKGTAENMFLTETPTSYTNWSIDRGKFVKDKIADEFAVRLTAPSENLTVQIYPDRDGRKKWGELITTNITGFLLKDYAIPVRSKADSRVRLKMGGTVTGVRTDIVIDNVKMTQWASVSYDDIVTADGGYDPWFNNNPWLMYGCPTNYVYLSGQVLSVATGVNEVNLQPMRSRTNEVVAIRGPLLDGDDGRSVGLGMFSFDYRDADSNCVVEIQSAAADSVTKLHDLTWEDTGWVTEKTCDFSTMSAAERKQGTFTCFLGKSGYKGLMRLRVSAKTVNDANDPAVNRANDPDYGRIVITGARCRDQPPLDDSSWWGWNLRTSDDSADRIIYDCDPSAVGLSLILNNGVTKDYNILTNEDQVTRYPEHVPFVQTPVFGAVSVGEVTFKARKAKADDPNVFVTLLGFSPGEGDINDDAAWRVLDTFEITDDLFRTCSSKLKKGDGCKAFRFAVGGVPQADGRPATDYREELLRRGVRLPPDRVILDEMLVSEAVYGTVSFRDVHAFRSDLDKHTFIADAASIEEQPMCEEAWSVQCEIFASQLSEEVVLGEDTEVWFSWHVGKEPWGAKAWKDAPTGRAKLERIAGKPGFFFRGSYPKTPAAIVDPVYRSGEVVQYTLDVTYRTKAGDFQTDSLEDTGTWEKPSWFRGVDFNAQYGGFAAYTILDTVAYGYAWINEANVYDGPTPTGDVSGTNQFVEVAIPAEADITGWKLQFVTGGLQDDAPFFTNTVVTYVNPDLYDYGVPGRKTKNMDPVSKYVFITAGNPASATPAMKAAGWIDGQWTVNPNETVGSQINRSTGKVDGGAPLGIQLVRPSGVIEHQIVIAGTNRYAIYGEPYTHTYSATNFAARLRALDRLSSWYAPCEDAGTNANLAVGVTNFTGVADEPSVWAHLAKTPGRINVGEWIPKEHPRPQGSMLVLYAQVKGGHVSQSIAGTNSTENLVVYVPKGLPDGTNIVYHLDNWYEIAEITETDEKGRRVHPGPYRGDANRDVVFATAKNASNDVTLVATVDVRSDLTGEYGLGRDNAYSPAVLDWLMTDRRGPNRNESFANPGGDIYLAEFVGLSGMTNRLLRLTEMYWLDIDPTVSGQVFQAGMSQAPVPVVMKGPHIGEGEGEALDREDIRLGVLMVISNKYDATRAPYAPYTLNGIEPGRSSMFGADGWDSVTFKITGYLANGLDKTKDPAKIWMPLRYFVFDHDSFDETFQAVIQVTDPFVQFADWRPYSDCPVYFRWDLDTRKFGAVGNEVLRPDSTYPDP